MKTLCLKDLNLFWFPQSNEYRVPWSEHQNVTKACCPNIVKIKTCKSFFVLKFRIYPMMELIFCIPEKNAKYSFQILYFMFVVDLSEVPSTNRKKYRSIL